MANKFKGMANPAEAMIKKKAAETAQKAQEEAAKTNTTLTDPKPAEQPGEAPEKAKRGRPVKTKGKKKQISLMIEPELYEWAAEVAEGRGISTAGLMRMALLDTLNSLDPDHSKGKF